MGLFGKITGIFKRGKEKETPVEPVETTPELPPELPSQPPASQLTVEAQPTMTTPEPIEPIPELPPSLQPTLPSPKIKEGIETESLKAKIDLLITQVENLKVQSENINERLKMVEKLLQDMRRMRYY